MPLQTLEMAIANGQAFFIPRKGIYIFSCSLRAITYDEITVEIVQNGRIVLIIVSSVCLLTQKLLLEQWF